MRRLTAEPSAATRRPHAHTGTPAPDAGTTTRSSLGDVVMLTLLVRLQTLIMTGAGRIRQQDDGATAVEYGLLVGFVALAIVATVMLIGPRLAAVFASVTGSIPAA